MALKTVDPIKARALTEWVRLLCTEERCQISSLKDLRDGHCFVAVIKKLGKNTKPDSNVDGNKLEVTRNYLETFYPNVFDSMSHVINFPTISDSRTPDDVLNWEIAKLLLALLCALLQDKGSDRLIQCTDQLTEVYQVQIMDCFKALLMRDPSLPLEEDFADVLTRPAPSKFSSPEHQILMSTPTSAKVYKQRTSNVNDSIFENTLGNSFLQDVPSTPSSQLRTFLSSPVMLQRSSICQLSREIRTVRAQLRVEQHEKDDLELVLCEKSRIIEEKDQQIANLDRKIRELEFMSHTCQELEAVIQENHKLKDDLNRAKVRLEKQAQLKAANLHLTKTNENLERRLTEYKRLEEQCGTLERQNKKMISMLAQRRFEVLEFKGMLDAREKELQSCRQEITDLRYTVNLQAEMKKVMKKEKDEMKVHIEELQGAKALEASESMGVTLEVKVRALEEELQLVRSTWVQPSVHNDINSLLEETEVVRDTLEKKYFEVMSQLNNCDTELKRRASHISLLEEKQSSLENALQKKDSKILQLEAKVKEITMIGEQKEKELQKQDSDNRSKLDSLWKRLKSRISQINQLNDEIFLANKKIENLEAELKSEAEKVNEEEEKSRLALEEVKNSLLQTQDLLDKERQSHAHTTALSKQEVKSLKDLMKEKEEQFFDQVTKLETESETLKLRYEEKKNVLVKKLNEATANYSDLKNSSKAKIDELLHDVQNLQQEKNGLQRELDRAKIQGKTQEDLWRGKLENEQTGFDSVKDDLTREVVDLKAKNKTLKETYDQLQNQLHASEVDLEKVKNSLYEVSMKYERRLSQSENERAALGKELTDHCAPHKEELCKPQSHSVGPVNIVNDTAQGKMDVDKSNGDLQCEVENLGLKLSSTQREAEMKQREFDSLKSERDKLQENVSRLETEVDIKKSETESLHKDNSDIKNNLSEMAKSNEQLKQENTSLLERCSYLKVVLEKTVSKMDHSKSECEILKREVQEKMTQYALLQEELESCKLRWEQERFEMNHRLETLSIQENARQEVANEKDELLQHISILEIQAEEMSQKLQGKSNEVDSLVKTDSELTEKLSEMTEKISDVEIQVCELAEEKSGLQSENSDLLKQISDLQNHNSELLNKLEEQEGRYMEYDKKTEEASELKAIVTGLTSKLTDAENQIQMQRCDWMSQLKAASEARETVIFEKEEQLAKRESELEETKDLLDNYKTSYNEREQVIARLKTEVQVKTEENQEKERKVESLNSQIHSLEEQLQHSNTQVKDLQNKMDATGIIYLGDGSEFRKMKKLTDTCNESMRESLDSSLSHCNPLDDSIFIQSPADYNRSQEAQRRNDTEDSSQEKNFTKKRRKLFFNPLQQAPRTDSIDWAVDQEPRLQSMIPSGASGGNKRKSGGDYTDRPSKQPCLHTPSSSMFTTPVSGVKIRRRSSSRSPRVPVSRTKLKNYSKASKPDNAGIKKRLGLDPGSALRRSERSHRPRSAAKVDKLINLFNKRSESTPVIADQLIARKKSLTAKIVPKTPKSVSVFGKEGQQSVLRKEGGKSMSVSGKESHSTPNRKTKPTRVQTPIKPKSHFQIARTVVFTDSPKTPVKTPYKYLTKFFKAQKNLTPLKNVGDMVKSVTTPLRNIKVHPVVQDS